MSRVHKTGKSNRTDYIYYTAEGTKIVLRPGEDGVSPTHIELLHAMDDSEVNAQRRYDYKVTTHLDAYADDRNNYLDEKHSPERILEEAETLSELTHAIAQLLPQQQELFRKVYLEGRSNTAIAKEEGVSETAIRNRIRKLQNKIKKYF